MTNDEGRAAYIAMCEAVEHAEPVTVRMDAPIFVGGGVYRLAYDGQADCVVMLPDAVWRRRLEHARDLHAEKVSA